MRGLIISRSYSNPRVIVVVFDEPNLHVFNAVEVGIVFSILYGSWITVIIDWTYTSIKSTIFELIVHFFRHRHIVGADVVLTEKSISHVDDIEHTEPFLNKGHHILSRKDISGIYDHPLIIMSAASLFQEIIHPFISGSCQMHCDSCPQPTGHGFGRQTFIIFRIIVVQWGLHNS